MQLAGTSLQQWLTLGVTALAFAWAIFLYRRSELDKRKATARLVYAVPRFEEIRKASAHTTLSLPRTGTRWQWEPAIGEGTESGLLLSKDAWIVEIELHNDSEEVITGVGLSLNSRDGVEFAAFPDFWKHVTPRTSRIAQLIVEPRPWGEDENGEWLRRPHQPLVATTFYDGAGRYWEHMVGRPVRMASPMFIANRTLRRDIRHLRRATRRKLEAARQYIWLH